MSEQNSGPRLSDFGCGLHLFRFTCISAWIGVLYHSLFAVAGLMVIIFSQIQEIQEIQAVSFKIQGIIMAINIFLLIVWALLLKKNCDGNLPSMKKITYFYIFIVSILELLALGRGIYSFFLLFIHTIHSTVMIFYNLFVLLILVITFVMTCYKIYGLDHRYKNIQNLRAGVDVQDVDKKKIEAIAKFIRFRRIFIGIWTVLIILSLFFVQQTIFANCARLSLFIQLILDINMTIIHHGIMVNERNSVTDNLEL